MEKDDQKRKETDAEDKSGVIVAGPEAHARERGGKMPVDQDERRKDDPPKKPDPH